MSISMLSVPAIFDGQHLTLLEKVEIKKPQRVIITFLPDSEELDSQELHALAQQGGGLNFLDNEAEDVYTDAHLKVKF
jgi:hypothetical protein